MTARTATDLKTNLFQDGQQPGAISPLDLRDFVDSVPNLSSAQLSLGGATGRYRYGVSPSRTTTEAVQLQNGIATVTYLQVDGQQTFTKCGIETMPLNGSGDRLYDFQRSIGINTHVAQGATGYTNSTQLLADLNSLGITLIRDNATSTAGYNTIFGALGAAGIRVCFSTYDAPATYVANVKAAVTAGVPASAIVAIEGPNEPNNFPYTYGGITSTSSWQGVGMAQQQINVLVKVDPVLRDVPVATPSACGAQPDNCGLQYLTVPAFSFEANAVPNASPPATTLAKDGTVFADAYNLHTYPGTSQWWNSTYGDSMAGNFMSDFCTTFAQNFTGLDPKSALAKPKMITEAGLRTDTGAGSGNYVNQATQGKNLLNGMFQSFIDRFMYFIIYVLYDSSDGYGIYSAYNTPKLAGTYIKNTLTILADNGTNYATFNAGTPGVFGFTGLPAASYWHVFQSSDGSYWLVLWSMRANWNAGTNSATSVTGASVTIALPATFATVRVFDPTVSTTAQATTTNVSSVTLTLVDYPKFVQLVPAASTTHVQWAIYATANGVPTVPVWTSADYTAPLAAQVLEQTGGSIPLNAGVYALAVAANGPVKVRGFSDSLASRMVGYTARNTGQDTDASFPVTLNTSTPASTWPSNPTMTYRAAGQVYPQVWLRS